MSGKDNSFRGSGLPVFAGGSDGSRWDLHWRFVTCGADVFGEKMGQIVAIRNELCADAEGVSSISNNLP
jgi:hypothetical protein